MLPSNPLALEKLRSAGFAAALLGGLLLSAACQPRAEDVGEQPAPLLLISIDGFRHDYFDLIDSPNLDRLIDQGLFADSLHHVFPTKTFPTHYTLVTGRYPGTHGVVANSMWDPRRHARFSLRDRTTVGDGYWYRDGEPIWVTAESQGLTSATFFWPGSEAKIHRVRPTHWRPYDGRVPHDERIEQVLEWAAMPEAERPDLMTLYFSRVDSLGHSHGPAAPAVLRAAEALDDELGRLLNGLEALDQLEKTNIIVVSDHGMSAIDIERYIRLDDFLDLSRVRVSDWGPAAQIWARDMDVEDIVSALAGAHPKLRVWARSDIPERYRFGRHHRVPDVLAEADPGWMISSTPFLAQRSPPRGMHGWDPAHGEQHGIFLAHGPAFAPGTRSPALRSIDLYALLTRLLNLEAADHEGSIAPFEPYLASGSEPGLDILRFDCDEAVVEARIGPAHMSLHVSGYIHVLDRVSEPGSGRREFSEVDLTFWTEGKHAGGQVDSQDLGTCQTIR
ncbi:alkaline phosphatase family protein [Wenzhouxiangella sp. AB-CW3]|uniref:alkaline phosphatase family protein n=1 Tax=Wenzhouxiangella sp. AB-CW3 TaxID=2771012 RepID=UPI00168AA7DE|nr:ectonucleotide pyrophosphatase/phosphodiesterase [Wenzhouxiangella sp. AB-CW3]QOC22551.1 alkaline phosphatase family protein [Wenzhouxiangella sp. AB-CW3]